MPSLNSNVIVGIFVGVVILAVIYYMNQNDNSFIKNDGVLESNVDRVNAIGTSKTSVPTRYDYRQVHPQDFDNRRYDEISDSIVSDLVAQHSVEARPMEGGVGSFGPSDPDALEQGSFTGYGDKKQINVSRIDQPYASDEYDPRDFSYKKNKFTKRTPTDVADMFDINKMMPNDIEEQWFDIEPLMTTKKIKGTHLINPKVHMGVNTVMSSLRYGTHDLRGDVPNPKVQVSPWNNSTIEPDTNIRGICNPI